MGLRHGQVRQRAFHRKSRNGCRTCKKRGVRCDEEQPACARCTNSGRECLGYGHAETEPRETKDITFTMVQFSPKPDLSTQPNDPGLPSWLASGLSYFTNCTIPLLDRFRLESVWRAGSLQIMQATPIVQQVAILLGLQHRLICSPSEELQVQVNSLHIRTVRTWNAYLSQPNKSHSAVALACMLFALYETLQGHREALLIHLEGGLRLADQWNLQDISAFDRTVTRTLACLVRNNLFLNAGCGLKPWVRDWMRTNEPYSPQTWGSCKAGALRSKVESLTTAIWEHVASLQDSAYHISAEMYDIQCQLTLQLDIVKDQLTQLLAGIEIGDCNTNFTNGQYFCRMLMAHCLMLDIAVRSSTHQPQICFDVWNAHFKQIVTELEFTLDGILAATAGGDTARPLFSIDLGILPIIAITVSQCREPRIRRQAIKLLDFCPRLEGIWDGDEVRRIALARIEFEEAGLGDFRELGDAFFVPEENRIHSIQIANFGDKSLATGQMLVAYNPSEDRTTWDTKVLSY